MNVYLQVVVGQETKTYEVFDFARIGSSSECDVVVETNGFPLHALTMTVDDPSQCTLIVKADELVVAGQARETGDEIVLRIGQRVSVHSFSLMIVDPKSLPQSGKREPKEREATADRSEPTPAKKEIFGKRPEKEKASQGAKAETKKSSVGIGLQILILAVFAGAVLFALQFFSPQAVRPTESETPKTTGEMVKRLLGEGEQDKPLVGKMRPADIAQTLQYVEQLSAANRQAEAKKAIELLRTQLWLYLPKNQQGQLDLTPRADTANGAADTANGAADATSDGADATNSDITQLIEDERLRDLFRFVNNAYSKLHN